MPTTHLGVVAQAASGSHVVLNGYVLRVLRLPLSTTLANLDFSGRVAHW
jgi:hypothetical protein